MTSIIDILNDKTSVNKYISNLNICRNIIIQTRHTNITKTKSCRVWQLQYYILYLIFDIDISKLNDKKFIYDLCEKYYEILDLNCGPLYQFIALNNLNGFGIDYKTYIYCKKNKLELINNDLVNNALCIYGINKNTGKIYYDSPVYHYFTLIKNENEYYITSSYSSDYICIPYQITKLNNLDEFYYFCECINDLTNIQKKEYFIAFMKIYFLNGGIKTRYDEDTVDEYPKRKPLWILPEDGIRKELQFFLTNEIVSFDIACITNYSELIENQLK